MDFTCAKKSIDQRESTETTNTHTDQSCVSVIGPQTENQAAEKSARQATSSIHMLEDILAYHEHQRIMGANIDPIAVAIVRQRDGQADSLVTKWLGARSKPDISNCPTCHGQGFFVDLKEEGKGAQRCDHRALLVPV